MVFATFAAAAIPIAMMAATEISDAISTYSITMAPCSVFINLRKKDDIGFGFEVPSEWSIRDLMQGICADHQMISQMDCGGRKERRRLPQPVDYGI
jgi:hypothetical protein